MYLIVHQDITC